MNYFKIIITFVSAVVLQSSDAHSLVSNRHANFHSTLAIDVPKVSSYQEQINDLYQSSHVDACDLKLKQTRLKIAKFLDQNAVRLTKIIATPYPQTKPVRFRIGALTVKAVKEIEADDKFKTIFDSSWEKIDLKFKEVQSLDLRQELSRDDQDKLTSLLEDFKYILGNDKDRLAGMNMYLTPDSFPVLQGIRIKVGMCKSLQCKAIDFSAEEKSLVHEVPAYRELFSKFTKTGNHTKLEELEEKVLEDEDFFTFTPNQSVAIEDGQVKLPLILHPDLLPGSRVLSELVEGIWASPHHQLNLIFLASGENHFKLTPFQYTGRSIVSYGTKQVKLYKDVRSRAIAHEIGHVLGFPDNYFTHWKPKTCHYDYHYNPGDIMSHVYGRVLDHHWETLADEYQ